MDVKDEDKSEESMKNHISYYKSLTKVILDIQKEANSGVDPTIKNHLDERIDAVEKDRKRIREMFPEEKRYILLSYVREDQITVQMEKDRVRSVKYRENAPYAYSLSQYGMWAENEENRKLKTSHYEKYKKTGVNDHHTSYPPSYVDVNVLEYLTVEPREGLRNDGNHKFSTPTELILVEKRNELEEYSFMNMDYPDTPLPLHERVRKHFFKALTGQPVVTYKEDFEDIKKEYDLLFGSSRQESQILPTVQV